MSDVITIAISALALATAFYGIFERRLAAYAAIRVRITELLAGIAELNVEEGKFETERLDEHVKSLRPGSPIEFVIGTGFLETMASLTGRRALLTYQVLALLERLRPLLRPFNREYQLTATEHATLADSLSRLLDESKAVKHWEAAVNSAGANDNLRISCHNGFAALLAAVGDIDGARRHFQEAIGLCRENGPGLLAAFNLCSRWISMEMWVPDGRPEDAVRRAYELAQKDERLVGAEVEALRKLTTRTVSLNGQEFEECILDRLLADMKQPGPDGDPTTDPGHIPAK